MTEKSVTIKIGLEDSIGDRLLEIRKQRDALLSKSKINLDINTGGLEQARRAAGQAQAASASAAKDLSALGGAITSKAIAPLAQYQAMLGSVLKAGQAIGPGIVSALGRVSTEFQRQRDLASLWGTSGYMHQGIASLKSSLSSFLTTEGAGFTGWLQNASANLAQYRTALTVAAAMVGVAAAAALGSKHTQNYISSTLDSRLMARKLTDKAGAEKWIQSAQGTDWSGGRENRMEIFQTVLSKNKAMGQGAAQKATEDIEKFFFANQEMLQKKGFSSAGQLASAISAPQLVGDDATKFEDIFGLGFSQMSATARLGRLSTEAKGIDIGKSVQARPDEVLSKRLTATTQAMGDAVLPALNSVLGGFLKLSDIIGKIPGLGKAMGWGAVLMGAAAAGLTVVSMIGGLIPGLKAAWALTQSDTAAKGVNIAITYAQAAAAKVAAAGQWLLNTAMSANPLGIVIIAVAGLIAILYTLEKKFGIVTKAWQAFANSSIGKGIFSYIEGGKKALEDLIASLGKAYKSGGLGGVLHLALDALAANSPGLKVLVMIADFIRKLWTNSSILNKLFTSGLAFLGRISDFFQWLLGSINGMIKWLRDGLGVTKAEKKAKMDEIADKEGGYVWNAEKGAWFSRATNMRTTPSDRFLRAKAEYDKAPAGVFEGIPGLSDLTNAINDLKTSLAKKAKDALAPSNDLFNSIAPGKEARDATVTRHKTLAEAGYSMASDGEFYDTDGNSLSPDEEAEAKAIWYAAPKMDAGGQIRSIGSLIGHGGEEVDPAHVVRGGKTTLAHINELFSGGAGRGDQAININALVSMSVNVEKVASDIDIDRLISRIGNEGADKLLFALRNKLSISNLREIGYLRG